MNYTILKLKLNCYEVCTTVPLSKHPLNIIAGIYFFIKRDEIIFFHDLPKTML